jgi:hypothetical protein
MSTHKRKRKSKLHTVSILEIPFWIAKKKNSKTKKSSLSLSLLSGVKNEKKKKKIVKEVFLIPKV